MAVEKDGIYQVAVRDFRQARRRAALQRLFARLSGRNVNLFNYEDVINAVSIGEQEEKGVQTIPLDAIVGSVSRYHDFTRSFLPTKDSNQERWARIRMKMTVGAPMEPIEVFKIGDAYFVLDGNHRVSVSRDLGLENIQAHVTEIQTNVPLSRDDDVDTFICKARLVGFLQKTELDKSHPDVEFHLTVCNKYELLLRQIERYRGFLKEAGAGEVSLPEAAAAWCESVYEPTLAIIAREGILRDFPDRTEADLYVWLLEHQQELKEYSGWNISTGEVAHDLATRYHPARGTLLHRMGDFFRDSALADSITGGPQPGEWRRDRVSQRDNDRLFTEIFLILSHIDLGQDALRLALLIAQREDSDLYTSYEVVDEEDLHAEDVIAKGNEVRMATRLAGIAVNFEAEVVVGLNVIRERSRWVDLVVAEITYPPEPEIRARLSSYFHQLLQRCPRPVLAVPPTTDSQLSKALLPYDGSPKSREALIVASYLVQRWSLELVVLSINKRETGTALDDARSYLSVVDQSKVQFLQRPGEVAQVILATTAEYGCDFIVMGGFSHRPFLEIMLGSNVEIVLANGNWPVLICR